LVCEACEGWWEGRGWWREEVVEREERSPEVEGDMVFLSPLLARQAGFAKESIGAGNLAATT